MFPFAAQALPSLVGRYSTVNGGHVQYGEHTQWHPLLHTHCRYQQQSVLAKWYCLSVHTATLSCKANNRPTITALPARRKSACM